MNIKISNNISHESTNSMKEIILLNNMWGKNQGLKLDSTTCISNNSSKLLKIDYDGTKKAVLFPAILYLISNCCLVFFLPKDLFFSSLDFLPSIFLQLCSLQTFFQDLSVDYIPKKLWKNCKISFFFFLKSFKTSIREQIFRYVLYSL